MEVTTPGPSFGAANFGAAQLGDRRRTRRLVKAVDAMLRQPAGTLPDKFDDPAGLKGLYRLLDGPTVTHASVLAPARARALERMAATGGRPPSGGSGRPRGRRAGVPRLRGVGREELPGAVAARPADRTGGRGAGEAARLRPHAAGDGRAGRGGGGDSRAAEAGGAG